MMHLSGIDISMAVRDYINMTEKGSKYYEIFAHVLDSCERKIGSCEYGKEINRASKKSFVHYTAILEI